MKVHQQHGYVLHCNPYSESSLLTHVFTREYGRLTLIAKGGRRKKSGTRGLLLPFKPLLISWSGKGQLPILTGVEQRQHIPELTGTPLYCGYYINELILKLLHRFDPHETLFDRYHDALFELGIEHSPQRTLRVFETHVLKETGFGLVLDRDVETGEVIDSNKTYFYIPERGPTATESNGIMVSGRTLIGIHQGDFDNSETLSQCRNLTRHLIEIQLGGRSLRSRRVLGEIHKFGPKLEN